MNVWIITLLVLDLGLIILFLILIRRSSNKGADTSGAEELIDLLKTLLDDAQDVAERFEEQLKEKQDIIHQLNDKLDSHIITLNQLVSRAEQSIKTNDKPSSSAIVSNDKTNGFDFRNRIVHLSSQGMTTDEIAHQLSMPKAKIDLVLKLEPNLNHKSGRGVNTYEKMMQEKKPSQTTKSHYFDQINPDDLLTLSDEEIQSDTSLDPTDEDDFFSDSPMPDIGDEDVILHINSNVKETKSPQSNNKSSKKEENRDAEDILALAEKGFNSDSIAKRMGKNKGEVDLILEFKKKLTRMEKEM